MGNFLYGDLGLEHMIKSENRAAEVWGPTLYGSAQRMLAGYYYVVEKGVGLWYFVHKYNQRGGGYLSGTSAELNAKTVPSELISTLDFSTKDEFEAENYRGTMRLDSSYRLKGEIAEQVIPRLFQSLTEGKTLYLVLSNEQCNEIEYIQRGLGVCRQLLSVFPAIYQRGLNFVSGTVPNRHDRLSYRVMVLPRDYQDVYYHVNYETFHENVVDCGAAFPVSMPLTPLMRYYTSVCSGLPKNMEAEGFLSAVHPKLERADRLKLEPFELAYALYESVQPTQFSDKPEQFMDLWRTVCRHKGDFNLRRFQTLLPTEVKEYLKQKAEELEQSRKAEEAERQHKEAEEAERQRKEAEEAERQRKEDEEAERQRKEAEEAEWRRKEAEEAERRRKEAEEAERRRKETEKTEQQRKEAESAERQREEEVQKRVEEELQKRRREEEVQKLVEEEVKKRIEEELQKRRREEEIQKRVEEELQKRVEEELRQREQQQEQETNELEVFFKGRGLDSDRQTTTQPKAARPESALLGIKRMDVIKMLVELCPIVEAENRKKIKKVGLIGSFDPDPRFKPSNDVYPDNELQNLFKKEVYPMKGVSITHSDDIWSIVAPIVLSADRTTLYKSCPMAVYYSTAYYLKLGVKSNYCKLPLLFLNEADSFELMIVEKKGKNKTFHLEIEDVLRCYLLVLVQFYNDSPSEEIKRVIAEHNSNGEFEDESVMRYFSDKTDGMKRMYVFWHFISLFCGWLLQAGCWRGGYLGVGFDEELFRKYGDKIRKNDDWYADTSARVIEFAQRVMAFTMGNFSGENAIQMLEAVGIPEDIIERLDKLLCKY